MRMLLRHLWVPCALISIANSAAVDWFYEYWASPTYQEITEPEVLESSAPLPWYLCGDLIRNGPSFYNSQKRNYVNSLDGYARVTKWSICEGQVNFASKLIRSNIYNKTASSEDIPKHVTIQKTSPAFDTIENADLSMQDNTVVNVFRFPDDPLFIAVTDGTITNEIDLETLTTMGNTIYNDDLASSPWAFWSCGHPLQHPADQKLLVNWAGIKGLESGLDVCLYTMGVDRIRTIIACAHTPAFPYSIHSFSLTESYAIVPVAPVDLDFARVGANVCITCSIRDRLHSSPAMFYVFDITGKSNPHTIPYSGEYPGPIASITTDAFFTYHQVNSFESADGIVNVDLCIYESMESLTDKYILGDLSILEDQQARNTARWNCDGWRRYQLNIGEARVENVLDLALVDEKGRIHRLDLANVSPSYRYQHYCYAYAMSAYAMGQQRYEDQALVKVNVCKAASQSGEATIVGIWYKEGHYPGEPLFVADPSLSNEDDGIILSQVYHENSTYLLVLSAIDMQEIATVQSPIAIPFGFHGGFFQRT